MPVKRSIVRHGIVVGILVILGLVGLGMVRGVYARSSVTPWTMEQGFQNLVYGASTSSDVQRIVGRFPDAIVRQEQIFPVVENYYFYEEGDKGQMGPATVFVFENNLLVGLLYKSSTQQWADLTYFIYDNGDRSINAPIQAGFQSYYPNLPLYTW